MTVETEHREFPRAPLGGPVRYWEWNRVRTADAVGVSANGIFLRTPDVLPEGTHLTLRLELPGLGGLTVLGRVVRTVRGGLLAAAGMGVRFLDLSPTQRRLIVDFVTARTAPRAA